MVTFYVRDYGHLDHGYAATVHKAQGVTVDRAHVLATPHMDRHAAYVGLTRHRDGVALHYAAEDFADPARLARALGRERAKDTTLDYGGEEDPVRRYAERRGLDPLRPDSAIVVRQGPALAPHGGRFAGLASDEGCPVPSDPDQAAERQDGRQPVRAELPELPVPPPAPDAGLAQAAAAGRAGFRARFEAHRRQQAQARDEAAARELVGTWERVLEGYNKALPGMEADLAALAGARDELVRFARGLEGQPGGVRVLQEQGEAFGMAARPNLARMVADPQPERVANGIMAAAEDGMRAQLAAEREAEREREAQARRQRPSQGMSMGPG